MRKNPLQRIATIGICAAAVTAVIAIPAAAGPSGQSGGAPSYRITLSDVAVPNVKADGLVAPDVLSPQLAGAIVAQGAYALENPTPDVPYYGYNGDRPNLIPLPTAPTVEAHKTEPDKNVYLTLPRGLPGADPNYDYGTHFLFQGHESGTPGYITRINLDADPAHRVTLMATADTAGNPLPDYDGATWDPFAQRLLLTYEGGNKGGVWQSDLGVPAAVQDVSGLTGRGGYEGVQNDQYGNIYLVEDTGGKGGAATPNSKQPNSFVYRVLPTNPKDLTKGGKLQALQVTNGDHVVSFSETPSDADILGRDIADLHSYGKSFAAKWVTIHDTAKDGDAAFDANALAKVAKATAFKRPENGVFGPDGTFRDFYFTETGDTNAGTEAGAAHGGFGGIMHLNQDPKSDVGSLSIFYRGDLAHTGLDNIQFVTATQLAAVEDAGDKLHTQRNALDSAYLFDTSVDYGTGTQPVRFIAEGRDASATIDSLCGDACGNDGDNEITGIHVSNGNPGVSGILGQKAPRVFNSGWRMFYTRQHGDNVTYEVLLTDPGAVRKN